MTDGVARSLWGVLLWNSSNGNRIIHLIHGTHSIALHLLKQRADYRDGWTDREKLSRIASAMHFSAGQTVITALSCRRLVCRRWYRCIRHQGNWCHFWLTALLLWPPCVIGQAIIFLCPVVSSFFLSFLLLPNHHLSGRRLNVYHTSTHGVALVRI